jgi:hypothetical protein
MLNKLLPQLIFLFFCSIYLYAEDLSETDEKIFQSNFSQNNKLIGWFDVHKRKKENARKQTINPEWYKVIRENGVTFLRTKTIFGISSLLKSALSIDDSLDELELLVTFRVPQKNNQLVRIALTSRRYPAGIDGGGPFWIGHQDSGFMAKGYQYDIQYVNIIAWQKYGRQVWITAQKTPFNFLQKTGEWITWRMVYKHQLKELWFYRDDKEKIPFIIQRNVDLTGITLNSVWISANGTEYLNIRVNKKNKIDDKR